MPMLSITVIATGFVIMIIMLNIMLLLKLLMIIMTLMIVMRCETASSCC